MSYGQDYLNKFIRKLNSKDLPQDTLYMLQKIKVKELNENENTLAYTDYDNIFVPSLKKIMTLLSKSNKDEIQNMEKLIVPQTEFLESIIDHEVAHTLESIYKRIGMILYNKELLPNLINGSLGIYDEKSYENNKDKIREFMLNKFKEKYKPNSKDIEEFTNFINEYYIPNGPFGLINRISEVDNYIIDIYIENDIINLYNDKNQLDKKFNNLRNLLYVNNDSNEYSIFRCMQLIIDPRFDDSNYLNNVYNNQNFQNFLNTNIVDIGISPSLFNFTKPNFENLTINDVILEIKEIINNVRNFDYSKNNSYIDYKKDNKIDSDSISLLASKLAKIIYIKELQNNNDHENIKDIINSDPFLGENKINSNETDANETNSNKLNENFTLDNMSFEEKLDNLGHNDDYSMNLKNLMEETNISIEQHLISQNLIASLPNTLEIDEKKIIVDVVSKEISKDFFFTNDTLKEKRLDLFENIKNEKEFTNLKNLVDDFKSNLGYFEEKNNYAGEIYNLAEDYINGNDFLYSLNQKRETNVCIHCFIDDSQSMNAKFDSGEYSIMDYQMINAMLIVELFKNIEGVDIIVTNFPKHNNSINVLYDSKNNDTIDLSIIDAKKSSSPLYKTMLESNIKLKSLDTTKEIINIYMSDGDDKIDYTKENFNKDTFKIFLKDSFFIQLGANEIESIDEIFENRYFLFKNKEHIINNLINVISKVLDNMENNIEIENNLFKNK